jgi:hypothetical protein
LCPSQFQLLRPRWSSRGAKRGAERLTSKSRCPAFGRRHHCATSSPCERSDGARRRVRRTAARGGRVRDSRSPTRAPRPFGKLLRSSQRRFPIPSGGWFRQTWRATSTTTYTADRRTTPGEGASSPIPLTGLPSATLTTPSTTAPVRSRARLPRSAS